MNDQIICPHCRKSIPLTQALSHELQETYTKKFSEERNKLILLYQKRIREQEEKVVKETELKMREKISREMDMNLKDAKNEATETRKQNEQLQEQLLETNKLIRQLKNQNQEKELELEKKLAEEQEKIRAEEKKRVDAEYHLRILEKEKKLQDALKVNEELKRKLEQGSQQMQGEVLELELEHILKQEFPYDEIKPVAKGVRGGDIIQTVRNGNGLVCGSIIWESKRTKAWSGEWIMKLKEDQRLVKADCAVIISNTLPANMKYFGFLEGVCVGNYDCILGIAYALRRQLLELTLLKSSMNGKQDKMEVLYEYLSGTEFRHRVEAIIEAFTQIQSDIEKEKRWFASKWARQEKSVRKVIDNTLGMHGDLQSIMGKALVEIKDVGMLPDKVFTEDHE